MKKICPESGKHDCCCDKDFDCYHFEAHEIDDTCESNGCVPVKEENE